jgi:hypothetical protein
LEPQHKLPKLARQARTKPIGRLDDQSAWHAPRAKDDLTQRVGDGIENILAHHILAPFFAASGVGKNMMGKNISSFRHETPDKELGNDFLRISGQTVVGEENTMADFAPGRYGPTMAALIDPDRLYPLGPGDANEPVREDLARLSVETAFAPKRVMDHEMAQCCLAGLWLGNGFLDQSHTISQGIHTATGSYWHGIMHRRELDFSNAKYWFRRVGEHPVFEELAEESRGIAQGAKAAGRAQYLATQSGWDPFRFVDLCQAAHKGDGASQGVCRQVERVEWQLLFDFCYRQAVGD